MIATQSMQQHYLPSSAALQCGFVPIQGDGHNAIQRLLMSDGILIILDTSPPK